MYKYYKCDKLQVRVKLLGDEEYDDKTTTNNIHNIDDSGNDRNILFFIPNRRRFL